MSNKENKKAPDSETLKRFLAPIRIVLVHTSHPGNIGGVARAMKNMGLCDLYLVSPKEYPSERADWRSASAKDILDNAKVVDTLDEALEGCGLVIGTSARERRIPWPLFDPRDCADRAVNESQTHPVALMFGREDRGLTNEELQKCHYHVHIPTNEEYSSLNLAAAVQVLSYEVRMAALKASDKKFVPQKWDVAPAKAEELEHYFTQLEQTIVDIGFHDRDNPRQTMTRLRRLYNRVRLDQTELNILHGILSGTRDAVKEVKNSSKIN